MLVSLIFWCGCGSVRHNVVVAVAVMTLRHWLGVKHEIDLSIFLQVHHRQHLVPFMLLLKLVVVVVVNFSYL